MGNTSSALPKRKPVKESKEDTYACLRKIRDALVSTTVAGRGAKYCTSRGDLYISYPYDDARTCMKLSIHQPIPFDSRKRLNAVRHRIGGPLGFKYQIGNGPV